MKKITFLIIALLASYFCNAQKDTTLTDKEHTVIVLIDKDYNPLEIKFIDGITATTSQNRAALDCYGKAIAACRRDAYCICTCLSCDPLGSPNAGCSLGFLLSCLF